MSSHAHTFDASRWPFSGPINTSAISTKQVMRDSLPILLVTHDDDGDWQVLCGTTDEPADAMVICLGCLFDRDPTIGELADLPHGWRAWRASPSSPWVREARPAAPQSPPTS